MYLIEPVGVSLRRAPGQRPDRGTPSSTLSYTRSHRETATDEVTHLGYKNNDITILKTHIFMFYSIDD